MDINPVPLLAVYFSAFLSCLVFPFLAACGSSLLWSFLAVSGFVRVACQGLLVGEACVSVLVDGDVFLLSGVQ